ncbi:hypothetical protein W97_09293 [Coniosporium apollinis CBS 100218]|uniref:Rhodopsin domain-containing protein n=1 Tax=Coniosporium apollinis (strain CBS 100218) TaxID=1168221 RepID=R7Z795_CONA1|nr:uncharacterized protein W97_09293 [Coniosporium apollinis CBS 100218]EON70027.1 hypothetical protein W97_09293 [Coniosporium apollinis CBS 100218]
MDSFTVEAFTLLGTGIFIIGLRLFARITAVGIKNLALDDYLMCIAAVVYALETATAYAVGAWWRGLANNGMTDEQRKDLDPNSHEYYLRVGGSKTQLVGWSLYTLLLWMIKLCMTILYSRLTAGVNNMEIRVRIGYVVVISTYIATEMSILFGCRPFHKNWQISPDPGNVCQPAISKIDLYVTVVLNVLTDMYLLSIPLPMLWKANMSKVKKYSLILVFGGAVFVMMAGILRCALILMDPINGAQQAGSWACRETFVAVVIGNAPLLASLFRRAGERLQNSSLFSRHKLSETDGSYELGSRERSKKPRKHYSLHALPSTYHTQSDSSEHIVPSDPFPKDLGIHVTTEAMVGFEGRNNTDPRDERPISSAYSKPPGGYSYDASIVSHAR